MHKNINAVEFKQKSKRLPYKTPVLKVEVKWQFTTGQAISGGGSERFIPPAFRS